MAIDSTTTMTAGTAPDGREIISEINTVMTETAPDGTHTVAEITSTADPDDPTQIEGHLLVTETAPDGTETVTEIVTNEDGTFIVENDESIIEQVIEAAFGVEIGDDAGGSAISAQEISGETEFEIIGNDSEYETSGADFTAGDEMFAPTAMPTEAADFPAADVSFDPAFGFAADGGAYSAMPVSSTLADSPFETSAPDYALSTAAADDADRQAHAAAAGEAQTAADEFIAAGDYEAAAAARETAESESWEAGDSSMLGVYDAQDLTFAAEKQEDAEYYNEQQTAYAQAGDYEAAREASSNAAYATHEADYSAGGDDHTGQADAEYQQMDMAAWQQDIADDKMDNAAAYASEGNFETAEIYAASGVAAQESADYFGDLGEHGGDMAVFDPSSVVETGGVYDASAAVETGFDAGIGTSTDLGTDSGTDDI